LWSAECGLRIGDKGKEHKKMQNLKFREEEGWRNVRREGATNGARGGRAPRASLRGKEVIRGARPKLRSIVYINGWRGFFD
jgi:hypothetical protein